MPPYLARMVSGAAAAAAVVAARRAAELGWQRWHGSAPPRAADVRTDADLRDLLVWSAVVVGAVTVARKLAVSRAERLLDVDDD